MLLRTLAITVMLCSTITCGDDLLDLNETQMRIIAKELRNSVNSGAAQCKEIARKTTHARIHMSADEISGLNSLKCLSLPAELTCSAGACTCRADSEQDSDGKYSARCTHTKDGKTTSKTFKFTVDEIGSFEPPTVVTTTPPTDTTTPPDDTTTPPDDTTTPPDDTTTPPDDTTTPPDDTTTPPNNPAACETEEDNTLLYGESVLQLNTATPVIDTVNIAGMTCVSSESGANRNLRCESSNCACTATFQNNFVPQHASCSEI